MKFLTLLFIHYSLFTIHHSVAADAAAESSQGKRSTAEQRTSDESASSSGRRSEGEAFKRRASSIKPNIIVIMADDLGYGDVGCYGAKPENIKTPHIDQLAAEGLQFTSGYCSASTCTPTRYALLTGTHAFRVKGTGIAGPNSPALIQPEVVTMPDLLQKAGYKTAVIGKWHLGLGADKPDWNGDLKPGPLEIGFDYSFLLPTTNDRVPQVYVENHRVLNLDPKDPLWVGHKKPSPDHKTGISHRDELKMDWSHGHNSTIHNGISRIGFYTGGDAARFRDEDLADKWVEKSEAWIKQNKANPFFLYFASHDIHVPRMPHERFHGKSRTGFRGDAIVQLDWCVGEIVRILKEQGLEKNTMIVFCSDNGSVLDDGYKDAAVEKLHDHKPAGPYAGGKYKIQEGGTRTPFITCWPGTIKPGVSEQIVCTIDLGTSLAKHLGVSYPAGLFAGQPQRHACSSWQRRRQRTQQPHPAKQRQRGSQQLHGLSLRQVEAAAQCEKITQEGPSK